MFDPLSSRDAKDLVLSLLERIKPARAVIIAYPDGAHGLAHGLLLESPSGVIFSVEGGGLRSGYAGAGPNAYRAVLQALRDHHLATGYLALSDDDVYRLRSIDLATLWPRAGFSSDVIEREFEALPSSVVREEIGTCTASAERGAGAQDNLALLMHVGQFLARATPAEKETLRRCVECLSGGSALVRRHLASEVELLERLDQLERAKGATEPAEQKRRTDPPSGAEAAG